MQAPWRVLVAQQGGEQVQVNAEDLQTWSKALIITGITRGFRMCAEFQFKQFHDKMRQVPQSRSAHYIRANHEFETSSPLRISCHEVLGGLAWSPGAGRSHCLLMSTSACLEQPSWKFEISKDLSYKSWDIPATASGVFHSASRQLQLSQPHLKSWCICRVHTSSPMPREIHYRS
jgi:hypothetical protein